MNIIIFSKDRACQLDLLLSSYKTYFTEWQDMRLSILFKATTETFFAGYEKVIETHPEFNYVFEQNFKENLYSIGYPFSKTMFLVDDNVFINKFSINDKPIKLFEQNEDITCVSLRMNPNIRTCYTQKGRNVSIPVLNEDLIWDWKQAAKVDTYHGYPSDWGYPMSVDGHIFRTKDIINYIFGLNYNSPNGFEGALSCTPINGNKMVCFKRSVLFNNPVNKVQTINGNDAGKILEYSPEAINNKYINNNRLDFSLYENIDIFDPHQEEPLHFSDLNVVNNITPIQNVSI